MKYGMDYLFGARYQQVIMRSHKKGWAAGFFHGWFRDRNGKIETQKSPIELMRKMAKDGLATKFRIQLLWDDNHRFFSSDVKIAIDIAKQYEDLLNRTRRGIEIEISPFCEHNLKNVDGFLEKIQAAAPSCRVVNTPWQGEFSTRYKNEVHGHQKAPRGAYNYSFDGLSAVDADVTDLKCDHKGCNEFYWWVPQFNMRRVLDDPTSRKDRTVRPNPLLIKSIIALAEDIGTVVVPRGDIWKSHAEQHGKKFPTGRDCKPVFLTKGRYKSVALINKSSGRVRMKLVESGKLEHWQVWRLPEWGFKVWRGKMRTFLLKADDEIIGEVNPAFRLGVFK